MQDPDSKSQNELLKGARHKANSLDWAAAADLSLQAIALSDPISDPLATAGLSEFSGMCHLKFAFRSSNNDQFEKVMRLARDLYEKAAVLYSNSGKLVLSTISRCRSVFATFWLNSDVDARRKIIRMCAESLRNEANRFSEETDRRMIAETRNDFLNYTISNLNLVTEWDDLNEQFDLARSAWTTIIGEFDRLEQNQPLLESISHALRIIGLFGPARLDPQEIGEASREATVLVQKALEVSGNLNTVYSRSMTLEAEGNVAFNLEGNISKALSLYEKALPGARETFDTLELGMLYSEIASVTAWLGSLQEELEQRRGRFHQSLEFANLAIEKFKPISPVGYPSLGYATIANSYIDLATSVESRLEDKKLHLKRAVEAALVGTSFAKGTIGWQFASHSLSKALYSLATITESPSEKTDFLAEALRIREATVRSIEDLLPHSYWARGVNHSYLALLKLELSNAEQSQQRKIELVDESALSMERCLDLCRKSATSPGFVNNLAKYEEKYGDILFEQFELTGRPESAEGAVRAYNQAIQSFNTLGHVVPLPSLRWKIAKTRDATGDLDLAVEAFTRAAEEYRSGAKKLPGLGPTFDELAIYMGAWAEIESARQFHAEEQYGRAHDNYLTAATLLRQTHNWSSLSTLLTARSLLEKGEDLSQREKHELAMESFKTAFENFQLANKDLERSVSATADAPERREFDNWLRIASHRQVYAEARMQLEQARSLDRKGRKVESSAKFTLASTSFKTLADLVVSAQEQTEIVAWAQFCKSWALMKEAESKTSSEIFGRAASSFAKAGESTANRGLKLLALGTGSICTALESGTKFRQSRDAKLYSQIKRQLEIAADHYTEGGFKKAGAWTRATERLFDALMLLTEAEAERDVGKKTEFYQIAEKNLQLAAKLYGEAGFRSRKREALERLGMIREAREALLSPLEVLSELPTVSGAYLPPMPFKGLQAPGLDRFEEARAVGEVRTSQKELTVGSDFIIEIDVANVGRTPATLIKLENVVPDGCEPLSKEGYPKPEGSSLDLKGKRLDYLKTHRISLLLRAGKLGTFELGPRVMYADDKGNYRSSDLQPLFLAIREPGVSAATHAPPGVHIPSAFQFENQRSRDVFQHLVKEFLDDHMSRRIVADKAGWRSMMDIVRELEIPRSTLYAAGRRKGPVLAELERRGLVETRIFPGERGRGGEIMKVRVAYENTIVKAIVERAVMQNPQEPVKQNM